MSIPNTLRQITKFTIHYSPFTLLPALGIVLLGTLLLTGYVLGDNTLPPNTFAGVCSAWTPVNEGAFGLGTGGDSTYNSEEGFEVTVFDGRLYLGMEADNTLGARIWRTKADIVVPSHQADWEEVAADAAGFPFGSDNLEQHDHIDSLAVFKEYLYASTANRSATPTSGTMLYRSITGDVGSWTSVTDAGFGNYHNENFKDMIVFSDKDTDWLCGGTWNEDTGAEVWCSEDGITWTQKNLGGFGATKNNTATTVIWSSAIYSHALYFGTQSRGESPLTLTDDLGILYRTFALDTMSPTWTSVYTGAPGSYRIDLLGSLNGNLYLATRSVNGIIILRSTTGDVGTWTQTILPGMDDMAANSTTLVDGATVYNDALYLAVKNDIDGAQIWRTTDGLGWTAVSTGGFGDAKNIMAELISYNGYLYAWTSNYATGQRVYRSSCPICQVQVITQTERVDFPGVGATLTFTVGAEPTLTLPSIVTICVKPGAFPTVQTTTLPVARTIIITGIPVTVTAIATVSLDYTANELVVANVASDTLRLTRWDGASWNACPPNQRFHNPLSHTVICKNNLLYGTWAIVKDGDSPSASGILKLQHIASWTFGSWGGICIILFSLALTLNLCYSKLRFVE
ncbi:MAG: hypothetical protein JXA33_02770 [Anaerolineae bacterium]|nr:hypothetical protein [Anaerolineae bacterium]